MYQFQNINSRLSTSECLACLLSGPCQYKTGNILSSSTVVYSVKCISRIKAFSDSSQSKGGSKPSSPAPGTPGRLSLATHNSVPSSPLGKGVGGRSQFSAKDPTRPGQTRSNSRHSLSSPAPSPTKPAPSHTVTRTESVVSSSRSEKTTRTEVITNNGNEARTPINNVKTNNSKSAIKTGTTSITNGSGPSQGKTSNIDTPDRANSKQNILEVFQERNVPEKMTVQENNNINIMKTINNGSITPSERSQDSLNSEELPSFSSSIDEMELRDLRRVRREMDMRLVDREDQLEELAAQVERLLGVKSRLESEMSQIKKEHKREVCSSVNKFR